MSFLHPTCKEVSALASKREAERLSVVDTIRLRYHMAMCAVCRAFEHQMAVLSKGARVARDIDHPMPREAQERVAKKLHAEEGFPRD